MTALELECLARVNRLIIKHQLPVPRVQQRKELSSLIFVELFHSIFNYYPKGTVANPEREEDEVTNLDLTIRELAENILDAPLDHINGAEIIRHNLTALGYLLEIFEIFSILDADSLPQKATIDGEADGNGLRSQTISEIDSSTSFARSSLSSVRHNVSCESSGSSEGSPNSLILARPQRFLEEKLFLQRIHEPEKFGLAKQSTPSTSRFSSSDSASDVRSPAGKNRWVRENKIQQDETINLQNHLFKGSHSNFSVKTDGSRSSDATWKDVLRNNKPETIRAAVLKENAAEKNITVPEASHDDDVNIEKISGITREKVQSSAIHQGRFFTNRTSPTTSSSSSSTDGTSKLRKRVHFSDGSVQESSTAFKSNGQCSISHPEKRTHFKDYRNPVRKVAPNKPTASRFGGPKKTSLTRSPPKSREYKVASPRKKSFQSSTDLSFGKERKADKENIPWRTSPRSRLKLRDGKSTQLPFNTEYSPYNNWKERFVNTAGIYGFSFPTTKTMRKTKYDKGISKPKIDKSSFGSRDSSVSEDERDEPKTWLDILDHCYKRELKSVYDLYISGIRSLQEDMLDRDLQNRLKAHGILSESIRHQMNATIRKKNYDEQQRKRRQIRNFFRENRLLSIRAKQYYQDYQLKRRSKLLQTTNDQEQHFKNIYSEAVAALREQLQAMCQTIKERKVCLLKKQQEELDAIENFYIETFAQLANDLDQRNKIVDEENKNDRLFLLNAQRTRRIKTKSEIERLQERVQRQLEEDLHFRDADSILPTSGTWKVKSFI